MAEIPKPSDKRPHRATSKGFRDQRAQALEAALRANLKRRKAAVNTDSSADPADHENAQENDAKKV